MLGCMFTFFKGSLLVGRAIHQTIVVTRRQAVHQRNFASSQTLPLLNSIIHYYTLHYTEVSASRVHAYIDCWCPHWLAI